MKEDQTHVKLDEKRGSINLIDDSLTSTAGQTRRTQPCEICLKATDPSSLHPAKKGFLGRSKLACNKCIREHGLRRLD